MANVHVYVIPHKQQRYDTVGDYVEPDPRNVQFNISRLSDWRYEALVLIHEFVEYVLAKHKGINMFAIDDFDIQFEKERQQGLHTADQEPGHDPRAPYHWEHVFAEFIEKQVAAKLGVNWSAYNDEVNSL